jgi:hypothetical protein
MYGDHIVAVNIYKLKRPGIEAPYESPLSQRRTQ